MEQSTWRRSSFCESNGCVEVLQIDGSWLMRRSQKPWAILEFTQEEWDAFKAGVLAGEFDL